MVRKYYSKNDITSNYFTKELFVLLSQELDTSENNLEKGQYSDDKHFAAFP